MERSQSAAGLWSTGARLLALQFVFALSWTVYALYLPQLLQQAGLPRTFVLPILMIDQVIFAMTDLLVGIQADRVNRLFRGYGRAIVIASTISAGAFVALPFVAPTGAIAGVALLASIALWAVTSAALRVPPLLLFAKHATKPPASWIGMVVALGMGLAAMCGPLLTLYLRSVDPRLPFALSSAALLTTVFALVSAEERSVSPVATTQVLPPASPRASIMRRCALFIIAMLILALGFQIHSTITSPKLFAQFVKPDQMPILMSVFWIGFNLAVLPAGWLTSRLGGLIIIASAAVIGGIAIAAMLLGRDLVTVIGAQAIAGAAWGAIVVNAFAGALAIGGESAAGRVVGLTFASFAIATFGRMAATFAGLAADPTLLWMPAIVWILVGLGLAGLGSFLQLRWSQASVAH